VDGGPGWRIGEDLYPTNPKLILTEADWAMVSIWGMWRAAEGVAHLPDAGGAGDEATTMIDAMTVMDAAAAEVRKLGRPE